MDESDRIPDVTRGDPRDLSGPAADLAARSRATDRANRFAQRLDAVQAARARASLRRRVAERLGWVALVVAAVGGGWWLATGLGVATGLTVVGLVWVARDAARRIAVARGAEAWDWQAGRYRLLGRPARRVQMLDRPPTDRPKP